MGLQKDGVRAVWDAMARWPGGLWLGLFTTVPSWDADSQYGVQGDELDVPGYSRRGIDLSSPVDTGDAVVTALVSDTDFGPFESGAESVTVAGWGLWAQRDINDEPAELLLAAGLFVGDGGPEPVTVPDGMQLRVASNELMIGIGPVERLAG